MRAMIKSPLLWFFLTGGLLFVVDYFVNNPYQTKDTNQNTIYIGQGEIDKLRAQWKAQSDRQLTDEVFLKLLSSEINQKRLYKEALQIGLDKDDVIIRRRLIQKLRFLTAEITEASEPTNDELLKYYKNNQSNYPPSDNLSFRHILIESLNSSIDVEIDTDVKPDVDWVNLSAPFMHGHSFVDQSIEQLNQKFGPYFIDQIKQLPVGHWSGPVDSLYGRHLVIIDRKQLQSEQLYEEIKETLRRDFLHDKRKENFRLYLAELKTKYPVIFDEENQALKELVNND